MSQQPRSFHLGDVLSVTTGLLVSPGHIAAVHELLDFMTSDTLYTHQLPRAMGECQPELLRQHPDLAAVPVPGEFSGKEHVMAWLAEQVARYGEQREVTPLRPQDHTRVDPVQELAMNYPDVKVVPVIIDEADDR